MSLSDPDRGVDTYDRLPIVSEVGGSIIFTTAALFAWNNAFRILPFSSFWSGVLAVVGLILFTPSWMLLRRFVSPLNSQRTRLSVGTAGVLIVLFSFDLVGDARRSASVTYFEENPDEVMGVLREAMDKDHWLHVETIVGQYRDVEDPAYLELEAEARKGLDRWYKGLPN